VRGERAEVSRATSNQGSKRMLAASAHLRDAQRETGLIRATQDSTSLALKSRRRLDSKLEAARTVSDAQRHDETGAGLRVQRQTLVGSFERDATAGGQRAGQGTSRPATSRRTRRLLPVRDTDRSRARGEP
jgi:hypothetical protein